MPKVEITEVDYTGAVGSSEISIATFIPGLKSAGGTATAGKIELCRTVAEFMRKFGTQPTYVAETETTSEYFDKSWVMAHQLLKAGMPVYYIGYDTKAALDAALTGTTIWTELADKSLYDVRFITVGVDENKGTTGVARPVTKLRNAIDCAASRGDAIALVDAPEDVVTIDDTTHTDSTVLGFISGVMSDTSKGKYASAFAPWCYCDSIAAEYSATPASMKTNFSMPGSFIYLGAFIGSVRRNRNWLPSAGAYRGVSVFSFEPKVRYGDAAIAALQSRTPGAQAVNPICEIRPLGTLIYGNRTLLPNANVSGGLMASSFLNIRQLCCDLKKTVYDVARRHTFEPNDETLWCSFVNGIQPLLDDMKAGRGILGSRIIPVPTDELATLKAKIRIVPIEGVEDFYIEVGLADSLEVVEG